MSEYNNLKINSLIAKLIEDNQNLYEKLELANINIIIPDSFTHIRGFSNSAPVYVKNNIFINQYYYKVFYSTIILFYKVKSGINLNDLYIPEELINEETYFFKMIGALNISFPKNKTYNKLDTLKYNSFAKYTYDLTPKEFKGNIYYDVFCNFEPLELFYDHKSLSIKFNNYLSDELYDFSLYDINFLNKLKIDNKFNDRLYPLLNLIDSSLPYNPRTNLEKKLNLLNDECEKEEMRYIIDLYKDMKNIQFTKPVVNIIKAYIANLSENVLFQMQNEIKDINEIMTGEHWGLESYIHNLE